MPKTKWSALLTLFVVFLSGAMVGVFGHRLYMVRTVNGPEAAMRPQRPNPEEVKRQKVKEIQETVKLDDAQVAQVNQAYDDTRKEFEKLDHARHENMKTVNEALHDKIREILKPDQRPLYENLLQKWDAERKQRFEKMRQQGLLPPPPSK
jgi:cell division protein FtsI/penicillin-binding protein 2